MIDKIKEYTDDAVDFAAPYIQSAHKKAAKDAKFLKKYLFKNARNKVKAAKRYRFITKLKRVLELVSSALLLAASILALVSLIKIKIDDNNAD